jgi:hypothetical protein
VNSELIEEPYYPNDRALFPPFKRATHGRWSYILTEEAYRALRPRTKRAPQLYSQSQRSCILYTGVGLK